MPGIFGQSMKYPIYFNITYILHLGIIYIDKCYLGKVLKESHEKAFIEKMYMKKKEMQNKV
jgi:hypothetical protein